MDVSFENHSFCFTGALVDLKRSAAQREVRARGGFTLDRVNEQLDYLVVGAKGSPAWKHGSYGRKIEEALALRAKSGRPAIVGEPGFMDALAAAAPTNAGAIDAKVVVVTVKFSTPDPPTFDQDALEQTLASFQQTGAHVRLKAFPVRAYRELFGSSESTGADCFVIEVRLVRQVPLGFDSGTWLESVERSFELIAGVDGAATWFERVEGSADYVRLLGEVPQALRIPGL